LIIIIILVVHIGEPIAALIRHIQQHPMMRVVILTATIIVIIIGGYVNIYLIILLHEYIPIFYLIFRSGKKLLKLKFIILKKWYII
jgi:hypothetical protein